MWGQRRQGKRAEGRFRLFSPPNLSGVFVGGNYLYIMARSVWESSTGTDMAGQKPGYISIAAVKPIDEVFFHDTLLSIYAPAALSSASASACGVSARGGPPFGGPPAPAFGGGPRGLLLRVESGRSSALLFSSCSLK